MRLDDESFAESVARSERLLTFLRSEKMPADFATVSALLGLACHAAEKLGTTREVWLGACAIMFDSVTAEAEEPS